MILLKSYLENGRKGIHCDSALAFVNICSVLKKIHAALISPMSRGSSYELFKALEFMEKTVVIETKKNVIVGAHDHLVTCITLINSIFIKKGFLPYTPLTLTTFFHYVLRFMCSKIYSFSLQIMLDEVLLPIMRSGSKPRLWYDQHCNCLEFRFYVAPVLMPNSEFDSYDSSKYLIKANFIKKEFLLGENANQISLVLSLLKDAYDGNSKCHKFIEKYRSFVIKLMSIISVQFIEDIDKH